MCSQTSNDPNQERRGLRVAAIQMVSGGDVEGNLRRAALLLDEARGAAARLAVLPENFACFGTDADAAGWSEAAAKQVIEFVSARARADAMWILAGSIPLPGGDGRLLAASLLFAPDGRIAARYDKLHLFDVDVDDAHGAYRESARFAPGGRLVCADVDGIRLGLSICYDLRFPELYRALASRGAQILLVPSAFTRTTGAAHWEALLRARAIENLAWVVAADQGGLHPCGRETWGHSMIVGPWGEVVASAEAGEAVVTATLDLQSQQQRRQAMPVLAHARLPIGDP